MSTPNVLKITVPVQDGAREIAQCARWALMHNPSRLGCDAWDPKGREIEFKTTSKPSVSTARDLDLKTIDAYAKRFWITTRGVNYDTGFEDTATYFLAPQHMEGWYAKIRAKIGVDQALIDKVMPIVIEHLTETECARLVRLLDRGKKLNDPNIPWTYIVANGIEITDAPAEILHALIEQYASDEVVG